MNKNISKTYISTALIAIAIASILMMTPTAALAASVHLQGQAPRVTVSGNTASSTSFVLAGVGNVALVADLTITGFFATQCTNPGGNVAPGQNEQVDATTSSGAIQPKNGKATIPPLSVTATPPPPSEIDCPNSQWTGQALGFTSTGATLTVKQNNVVVFGPVTG